MNVLSKIIKKHLTSDFGGYDHYEPYFDRWEEAPFHLPEDNENYDTSPEGVPTKLLDTGDFAIEVIKKWHNSIGV